MPYQTCIDCGTREHSRCYNSTAVRINNDTGRGARPSDQRKLEALTKKPLNATGDTVVDMEVIRDIRRLKDAVATLQIDHCRIMAVYDKQIELLEDQISDMIRNKHPEDVKLEQFYYDRPIGPVKAWIDCVPQGTEQQCYIPQSKHWRYA